MSIEINQIIGQMREIAAKAHGVELPASAVGENNFQTIFKQAIDGVNESQLQATELQNSFERGDTNVSLAEVMVATQKSSVSFQAAVQVRNRLVQAYQDIMNMQV